LRESGCSSEFLELEITEGILLNDLSGTLQKLINTGISLSIDDFGTGYCNLNYIKNFPVNKLKIDQSFIKDINRSPDDRAITKAIITIAKSLNLKVIAEGVESQEVYDFLRTSGCDAIQGYFCSKPLPAKEFMVLLKGSGV
jgi:EAL domain-containing protein (putative c-di-GMP-specific phosphodiesterase class I)